MHPENQYSDAQLLAEWARYSLTEGRYELAEALTRLTVQVSRSERQRRTVNVPFAGATRPEQPVRVPSEVRTPPTPTHDLLVGTADVGATQMFERPYLVREPINGTPNPAEPLPANQLPANHSPDSAWGPSRCTAVVERDGVPTECRAVIVVNTTSGGANYWEHIDTALDVEHMPIGVVK